MSLSSENTAKPSGSGVMQSSAVLLLLTGTMIGFNFPLGKIAGDAGVSPMLWALLVSLGASGMLLPVLLVKRQLSLPRGRTLRYVVISGLISFVLPNLLLFSVIPHAGSGYTGLMFALSPVFTLSLAVLFRMKTPSILGIAGITTGLIGAVIVSITRGSAPEAPDLIWIGAAILIPVALACGNIYRTIDWPEDAQPNVLAFWSHAFSVAVFIVLLLITNGSLPINELAFAPTAAAAQIIIAGLTFPVFFKLQQKGGPVLLSQIGYVAAAVGLITATFILGESYSLMTWVGAGVIACGIAITVVAQIKERL
ncbi:DMT family transporter [Kiloniella antarctica]|uniref:DMT family transporter n=1 Tax=Kiloniella antarctica TaxID=1550907 RepID=A0ABW5BG78_9PROT